MLIEQFYSEIYLNFHISLTHLPRFLNLIMVKIHSMIFSTRIVISTSVWILSRFWMIFFQKTVALLKENSSKIRKTDTKITYISGKNKIYSIS